jgi:hypothetical protein
LLRQHVLHFVLAKQDFVDGISSVLEGYVVAIDIRGQEYFWVPRKALAGREVCDQTRRAIWVPNVDDGRLLLGKSDAEQTGATAVHMPLGGRG